MCFDVIELTRRELLKVFVFLGIFPRPKRTRKQPGPSTVPPFIWS